MSSIMTQSFRIVTLNADLCLPIKGKILLWYLE